MGNKNFEITHFVSAVLLKQIYPPNESSRDVSTFLGGSPWLPSSISWPINELNKPLHFFAQIDLEELPNRVFKEKNIVDLPRFATKGSLFFFLTISDELYEHEDKGVCKVVYYPGRTTKEMSREIPTELDPLEYGVIIHSQLWDYKVVKKGHAISRRTYSLPRVPLSTSAFLSNSGFSNFEFPKFPRTLTKHGAWLVRAKPFQLGEINNDINWNSHDRFGMRFGFPDLAWNWLDELYDKSDVERNVDSNALEIPKNYPWCWLQIERTAQSFISYIDNGHFRTESNFIEPYISDAINWISLSQKYEVFQSIGNDVRVEFRNWIQSILDSKYENETVKQDRKAAFGDKEKAKEWRESYWERYYQVKELVKRIVHEGFFSSWPYCVASANFAELPKDFVERMEPGHASGNQGDLRIHQMFGEPSTKDMCGDLIESDIYCYFKSLQIQVLTYIGVVWLEM